MSKIYITGDCHATFGKFTTELFPDQKELTKDDYVIVCGDFGGVWDDCAYERHQLDWLNKKNFTTLFVDGNHENFDRLYSDEFPVVDFCGGKAHKIRDSVYHLIRGYMFHIGDKSFFAFGGAASHDIRDGILQPDDFASQRELFREYQVLTNQGKLLRINHLSWWEQELPSDEEIERGMATLKDNGYKVDYIITHCAPQSIASMMSGGLYKPDRLTNYFETINQKVKFDKWFFGHYHRNDVFMNKYVLLYNDITRIV